MKKGSIIALATGLALTVSATALAANVNDVQNLETQLQDKLQSVQQQSLSDAQKTALQNALVGIKQGKAMTAEQKAQWEQARAAREAQLQAFKATLSSEQAAALDALRPGKTQDGVQPARPTEAERQALEAQRDAFIATLNDTQKAAFNTLFERKQVAENMTAEQQAQMEAKRAERQAQEDAFTAMLTQEQKAAYEAMHPQQTQDKALAAKPTEAERQAYKAMRDTFVATLNDTQKAAFDGLHAHGGRPLDKMTQVELDEYAASLQAALDTLNQIVP